MPTALLEDKQILELLEQSDQQWAAPVTGWTVESGEDSLDYPTIWVLVLLDADQLEDSQEQFDKLERIRKQVRERIAESGERRWVYVRFRTRAGQAELDELEREEALEKSQEEAPARALPLTC